LLASQVRGSRLSFVSRGSRVSSSKTGSCFDAATGRAFAANIPRRLRSCATESKDRDFLHGLSASVHECKSFTRTSERHARLTVRSDRDTHGLGVCIRSRRGRAAAQPYAKRQLLWSL